MTWVDINSNYGNDGKALQVYDDAAIDNSLYNLMNCIPGQRGRTFQPEYGSWWREFLQENIGTGTASKMKTLMIKAIARWEPRIKLDQRNTMIIPAPLLPGYQVRIAWFSSVTNQSRVTAFTLKTS